MLAKFSDFAIASWLAMPTLLPLGFRCRCVHYIRHRREHRFLDLKMLELLKKQDADILCLQEFHTSTIPEFYDNITPIAFNFLINNTFNTNNILDNSYSQTDILLLAIVFTILTFLAATQDIVVDGWAIRAYRFTR